MNYTPRQLKAATPLKQGIIWTKLIFALIISLSFILISCGDETNTSSNPCEPNLCADSPVAHKTTCELVGDNDFQCVCESGYELLDGYCKWVEIDPCEPNPCIEEYRTNCTAVRVGASAHPECSCNSDYKENDDGICEKLNNLNLRLVAANITSGNYQNYDWGDGVRIFQATNPDVIMIQELNYKDNKDSDYEELTEKIFEDPRCIAENRCYYYAGFGQIPNGIMSKYKILSRGYWNDPGIGNRNLEWATIDLPGKKDLFVVSVHLSTKGGEQTRPAAIIAENVTQHKLENPDKFYYAVGGDFNGSSSVDPSYFGKNNAFNIYDKFPKSKSGNYDTSASRTKHYDWLLVDSSLSDLQTPSKFCNPDNMDDCLQYVDGLVMDTREYTSTEINKYFSPSRLEDSGAINMQHMSVIKDFKIILE